jgi:toxin ParE1/3/4
MLKIHKHHQAEQDLLNIWLYTFENWGVNQADKHLDQIDNALKNIASNPYIGVNIDKIREGYKKYQINEHILFYTVTESTINVIRILGNDMDYLNHL